MKRVVLHLGLMSAAALVAGPSYASPTTLHAPIQLAQSEQQDQSAPPDTQADDTSSMDQPQDQQDMGDAPPDDNADMDMPDGSPDAGDAPEDFERSGRCAGDDAPQDDGNPNGTFPI